MIKLYFYPTDEHGVPKRFYSFGDSSYFSKEYGGHVCGFHKSLLDPNERTQTAWGKEYYNYVVEVEFNLSHEELNQYTSSSDADFVRIPLQELDLIHSHRSLKKREAMKIYKEGKKVAA